MARSAAGHALREAGTPLSGATLGGGNLDRGGCPVGIVSLGDLAIGGDENESADALKKISE